MRAPDPSKARTKLTERRFTASRASTGAVVDDVRGNGSSVG